MEQRIKVVSPEDGWLETECYIGNSKIENVKSIDFRVAVNKAPTFIVETLGMPNIDMTGDVFFKFIPDTVQQAAMVLQKEFENNAESKEALVASIASVLKEMPTETGLYDVAELIANRIIGIEDGKVV